MKKIWIKQFKALLAVVLLLGGCGTQPETEQEPAETAAVVQAEDAYLQRAQGIAENMDNKEKIEQLLILDVRSFGGSPMTSADPQLQDILSAHQYGGVILFAENSVTPGQTAELVYDLKKTVKDAGKTAMLVGVDQEGGFTNRIQGGTGTPGNMALGAAGETGLISSAASIIGMELSALGFNTDFAPCSDVNNEPANPVIGIRSFSDDPTHTASCAKAFSSALSEFNIISCAKHFPGHGNVTTDSHFGLPVSEATLDELKQMELIPFQALCSEGIDMIMTAHICFPNIETGTYVSKEDGQEINLPSTLSSTMVQGVLRDELGYEGVVCTDSLLMEAISRHFDPIDAAVLALNAGVDILLMPKPLDSAESAQELDAYVDRLVSEIGISIPQERIDEAVCRVLKLKAERGILDESLSEDKQEVIKNASEVVGGEKNLESARAIADQCVTVLENNGILPLKESGKVLLAGVQETQCNALRYGFERLSGSVDLLYEPEYLNISYGKQLPSAEQLGTYSAVIVTSWLDNMSQFDPSESVMIPGIQSLIENCRAANVPCIVISTGLPYDLSCYSSADALLAVYQPSGIKYDESGQITGMIGQNIPAAVDIIFGYAHPSGTLPVNVPNVEGTGFSDTIAYPRGSGLTW